MHRIDNSRFLLYIEPPKTEKLEIPVIDETTEIMETVFKNAILGVGNYYEIDKPEIFQTGLNEDGHPIHYWGFHITDCGEWSSGVDYLLFNNMITNSLCVFYLKYYRNSIPQSEMDKVNKMVSEYKKINKIC